jgi:hypothetical protein
MRVHDIFLDDFSLNMYAEADFITALAYFPGVARVFIYPKPLELC